jgi:hypothetical protein
VAMKVPGPATTEEGHYLRLMRSRGWTLYQWGDDEDDPDVIGVAYRWPNAGTDVALIHSRNFAAGYRTGLTNDFFVPELVTDFVIGCPALVLSTVLGWDPHGAERNPRPRVTPQSACGLPAAFRRQRAEIVQEPGTDGKRTRRERLVPRVEVPAVELRAVR